MPTDKSRKATVKQAVEDANTLSVTQAMQLEVEIGDNHEECPGCGEDFEDVALSNDGSVTFVHDSEGMFLSGCDVEDVTEVLRD